MPSPIPIRPYAAPDETGVLAIWNEAMWADPIDKRAWRSRYLLDPNFDPASCLVSVDKASGEVVGFLLGMRHRDGGSDGWVVGFGVRGANRRQGVGTALFDALEGYWVSSGTTNIVVGPWIPHYVTPGIDESAYADAIAFLDARGARVTSRPLSMKASLTAYRPLAGTGDIAAKLASEGVLVRPVEAADILPLLTFLDDHFPHWRGDATGILQALFAGDGGQVTMHVALDNGEIVGYAQSRAERFGPFGVNEAYRGRGIGAVLLSTTLLAMRALGYHAAWFLWTSDRAARLYQQHGFAEVRRFALMAKSFTPHEDAE